MQAAANQQATGAKEQATAMTEITTTISELLATSRQIAESAQRVAQIAEQTASAARSGHGTVDMTHESIAGIRRQVDQIVAHMLELGKKSQEIGAVLDIVSELAEQTNILAINATIEAAGAGEAGKRFAVVADEIRKLADRVGGSTKEIRALIEDVRSAVNTTVMATETGSKAVDAGSRQFGEVASAFKQIAGLVAATTDAAREIELSTKQQSTAVEQVNVADRQRRAGVEGDRDQRRPDAADRLAAGRRCPRTCCGSSDRTWRRPEPASAETSMAQDPVPIFSPRGARAARPVRQGILELEKGGGGAARCSGCCASRIRSRGPPASSSSPRSPTGARDRGCAGAVSRERGRDRARAHRRDPRVTSTTSAASLSTLVPDQTAEIPAGDRSRAAPAGQQP